MLVGQCMQRNMVIFLLFASVNLWSEEDIFADKDPVFEIDSDFEDDFTMGNGSSATINNFLVQSTDAFNKRGIDRDERSFSVSVANETIARVFHLSLMPEVRFKAWKVDSHLGLPLRFPVFDNVGKNKALGLRRQGFVNAEQFISPRSQDFRSFLDAQRLVRRVQLGKKDESYSLLLGREDALTLAHGDLMRDMTSDGLYDQDYLFGSGHISFEPVRFDAVLGPLPAASIVGLNARFLPLSSLNAPLFIKNTNADVSYIGDWRAPNEALMQDDAFLLDEEERLIKRNMGTAQGFSCALASEFFPVPWFSTKPYTSYSHLFLTGLKAEEEEKPWTYGAGFNLGHDATFYPVASNSRHVIVLRTEARLFSKKYQPNYFGGKYMLDRVNYSEQRPALTKSHFVAFPEDNSLRFGHLVELGYAIDSIFDVKIGYENTRLTKNNKSIKPLRKVHFNTGLFAFDFIRFKMGYEVSSLSQLGDLFDFEKSRALLSLRGQIKLMPFLYFDTWLKHSFGINEKYQLAALDGQHEPQWLSNRSETRSLNFGLGLELAVVF